MSTLSYCEHYMAEWELYHAFVFTNNNPQLYVQMIEISNSIKNRDTVLESATWRRSSLEYLFAIRYTVNIFHVPKN